MARDNNNTDQNHQNDRRPSFFQTQTNTPVVSQVYPNSELNAEQDEESTESLMRQIRKWSYRDIFFKMHKDNEFSAYREEALLLVEKIKENNINTDGIDMDLFIGVFANSAEAEIINVAIDLLDHYQTIDLGLEDVQSFWKEFFQDTCPKIFEKISKRKDDAAFKAYKEFLKKLFQVIYLEFEKDKSILELGYECCIEDSYST